ncbi:hypothetical protein Q3G72_011785 [Acer saccharum]|nr:hypothetical protein Q3G72_011785 [Acer saccharum]
MAALENKPALVPCTPENIPEQMRALTRWAPWAAPWNPDLEKYGKVPHRADRVTSGLSNGSAAGWVTFDKALAAYRAHPDLFAGIGYLMTGHHGVVGVDLDYCVKDGVVAPWAAEIAAKLDSYTEISPSGTGLHIFLAGDLAEDWSAKLGTKPANRKQPGIDVYGGGARFLTVTGAHVKGSPRDLRAAGPTLDQLAARYRKSKDVAKLHVLPLPDTTALEVPSASDLDLTYKVADFLRDGPEDGADRSNLLIKTGVELASNGLSPEQAFAFMVDNEHTWETALSKRGYDDTKAREYLWTHHCRRGAEIVEADKVLTLESFDALPAEPTAARVVESVEDLLGPDDDDPMNDFDDLTAEESPVGRDLGAVGLKKRFQFESLETFLRRPPPKWIIKGLLPQAALAVVFGPSGSGKTFFAMDMAVCVAQGRPWRGVPVEAGGVAYVVAEGAGGFVDRAQAYCHQEGIKPGELPLHILADAPNLMQNPDVTDLVLALKACGPLSVIFMDTYARVMGNGNENEAQDVNRVVRNCALIHAATGAIVVLIHHSGKDSTSGARGSSALRAAADAEVEIKKLNGFRTATITKMKDGADEAVFRFKLQNVVIGWDEDGEDRTSCVVEHLESGPTEEAEGPKPRGRGQQHILGLLRTYYPDVDVDKETFTLFAKDHAEAANDPNWRSKITEAIKGLVKNGFVSEISGVLRERTVAWSKESRQSRGYGPAWDQVRKVIIKRAGGLCEKCNAEGRLAIGRDVDHKTPKAKAKRMGWSDAKIDDLSNLWFLCQPCHQKKTTEETGRTFRPKVATVPARKCHARYQSLHGRRPGPEAAGNRTGCARPGGSHGLRWRGCHLRQHRPVPLRREQPGQQAHLRRRRQPAHHHLRSRPLWPAHHADERVGPEQRPTERFRLAAGQCRRRPGERSRRSAVSEENRLLKRLRPNTVKYVYDSNGKKIGIESPDSEFRVTGAGTMQPGATGKPGADGLNGVAGKDGSQIFFGTDPNAITGMKSGDVFVNTATWDVYRYS